MGILEVDLVAADQRIWTGRAAMVTAPAADGEIGILPGHSPVLSVLREGSVRIRLEGAETVSAKVTGGFLSVDDDAVTVVADSVSDVTRAGH